MAKNKEYWAVGRRKTSVARVKLSEGTGKITVNKLDIKDYIKLGDAKVQAALSPLGAINAVGKFDASFNVQAIRHALARALVKVSADSKSPLKKAGFLTRDSRMVERKKYGLHKARRGTQFSKR